MKFTVLFLITLMFTTSAFAQYYQIDWWVIGSGGGHMQSGNYGLDGTIGQPIVGQASSNGYTLYAGFWVPTGPPPSPGCQYIIGDINGNGQANGIDIVFAVNYFKGGPHPPIDCFSVCLLVSNPFYAAGDVNGNCAFNGIDITYYVRYLKGQASSLLYCPDCAPAGPTPPARLNPPVPAVQPIRAPVLKAKAGNRSPKSD